MSFITPPRTIAILFSEYKAGIHGTHEGQQKQNPCKDFKEAVFMAHKNSSCQKYKITLLDKTRHNNYYQKNAKYL